MGVYNSSDLITTFPLQLKCIFLSILCLYNEKIKNE